MKTPKTAFVCSECEYRSLKWMGRCPSCGAWNTLEETLIEPEAAPVKVTATAVGGPNKPVLLDAYDMPDYMRFETGYRELDRVLGGGLFMLGAGILAFFLGTYIVKGVMSAFKMFFNKN